MYILHMNQGTYCISQKFDSEFGNRSCINPVPETERESICGEYLPLALRRTNTWSHTCIVGLATHPVHPDGLLAAGCVDGTTLCYEASQSGRPSRSSSLLSVRLDTRTRADGSAVDAQSGVQP